MARTMTQYLTMRYSQPSAEAQEDAREANNSLYAVYLPSFFLTLRALAVPDPLGL